MTLKLYTDTHIARQVAVQLRKRGVDVVRCEEVGMATASDQEHLEYAIREGRAIVSQDQEFGARCNRWVAEGKTHPGFFCVSRKLRGAGAIGVIVMQLDEYNQLVEVGAARLEEDIHNRVIYIA